MEQQHGIFSTELEEQIAKTVITIVNSTAEESRREWTKRYFKKRAFCEEMGISFTTLQKWITKGLSVIQIEGVTLIDMIDAEKFLQDHKI